MFGFTNLKNKILENLKGEDKLLHSKVGNVVFLTIFILSYIKNSFLHALISALIVVFLVGLLKELYDKYVKHTFIDCWDIVAAFVPYPLLKKLQKNENKN
jgi:hypothetical protein|nr:MAG TPA: putative periplasmic lipoprotein [Caudoviricetes sp.]